jgi:hypothetical protein
MTARTSFGHPSAGRRQESDPAVEWLLRSREPSVRYLTLTRVLGRSARHPDVREAREAVAGGPRVRALLAGQQPNGGFGGHSYRKWTGAHWRLVSLVELGIPPGFQPALAAAEQVLGWLTGTPHRRSIRAIGGLVRRCASQEGNALAVCVRLGMAEDDRVRLLASSLVEWQWPDGGWNCDERPDARHSSFHESLPPLWGLAEFHRATGDDRALRSARRAAEFFLRHGLFRSEGTGEVIDRKWLRFRYPAYWHYDVLQGLRVLESSGHLSDPRTNEALDVVEARRRPDGTWGSDGRYWKPPGSGGAEDVVDWGHEGPNEMVTLRALWVLRAAGRFS